MKLSGGIKVVNISGGKISDETTMKKGFIIISVNGNKINTAEEFIRELQRKKSGLLLQGIYPGRPGRYYYGPGL